MWVYIQRKKGVEEERNDDTVRVGSEGIGGVGRAQRDNNECEYDCKADSGENTRE